MRRAVKILRRRRKLRRPRQPLLACVNRHVNILNRSMLLTIFGRNTSIWVLTSFVFLTSFRFMSSFAFLNFFVGLTSLDFELFWCLMLFVLFCFMTSFVLWTLSKEMCAVFNLWGKNYKLGCDVLFKCTCECYKNHTYSANILKRSVLSTFLRSSKWLFSLAISIGWWIIFVSNTRTMK